MSATPSRTPKGAVALSATCLGLAVLALGIRPLAGFDTWWHLAAGREIARTGTVPTTDSFSFTAEGSDWIDQYWLWQRAAYGLVRLAGWSESDGARALPVSSPARAGALAGRDAAEARAATALTLVNSLLLAAGFLVGFEALRRRGSGLFLAVAIPLAAAWGARIRFLARPEAAAMVLFAAAFFLLEWRPRSSLRGQAPDAFWGRRLAGLMALTALGANLHPSIVLLPVLAGLHRVGAGWEEARHPRGAVRAIPSAAACSGMLVVATMASPSGWKLWLVPLRTWEVLGGRSSFVPEWLPPAPTDAPLFFLGFAAVVVLLVLSVRRGEGISGLLTLVALGVLATTGIRHIGFFLIVLPIASAPVVALLATRFGGRALLQAATAAVLCPAVVAAGWAADPRRLGIDRDTTPVDACGFIELHEPAGRLYNDVRFGGYLDWRFAPGRKVFLDGRMELFMPLLRELEGVYSGVRPWTEWNAILHRFRIDGALVRYADNFKGVVYPARPGEAPRAGWRAYSAYLFPERDWALVYWDDTAMLWLRRGGPNEETIRRFAYSSVNPEDIAWQLERAAEDEAFRTNLRGDLVRRAGEKPPSRRTEDMLARLQGLPAAAREAGQ